MSDTVGLFIVYVFLFCLYFFPWLLATGRHHNNTGAIALTNFFFGWTVVGWLVALIWAASGNVARRDDPSLC